MQGNYNPIRKEVYQMAGNYRPAKTNVPKSNVPSNGGNVGTQPVPNKNKAAAKLKGGLTVQPGGPGKKFSPIVGNQPNPRQKAVDNLKKRYNNL